MNQSVIDWLLEEENSSIRYVTLVSLLVGSSGDSDVL